MLLVPILQYLNGGIDDVKEPGFFGRMADAYLRQEMYKLSLESLLISFMRGGHISTLWSCPKD